MSGEDGGHVDLALLAQGESNTRQPLVELCNNSPLLLVVDILCRKLARGPMAAQNRYSTHLAQEPCNQIAEDDSFVRLMVVGRTGNASGRPEVALPLVELVVAGAGVEEEHARCAVNQPSAVEGLDATVVHGLDGGYHGRVLGHDLLDFHGGRSAVERTQHGVV